MNATPDACCATPWKTAQSLLAGAMPNQKRLPLRVLQRCTRRQERVGAVVCGGHDQSCIAPRHFFPAAAAAAATAAAAAAGS